MNTRAIQGVIQSRFNNWTNSIKDDKVKELARAHSFVTGGAIASLLQGEEINDIDIYFANLYTAVNVTNYYVNDWNARKKKRIGLHLHVAIQEGNKIPLWLSEGFIIGKTTTYDGIPYETFDLTSISKDVLAEPRCKDYLETIQGRLTVYIPSVGVLEDSDAVDAPVDEADPSQKEEDSTSTGPEPYRAVYLTDNAISLSGKVQLIIRFVGSVEEVHKNFDFVHCTCWYFPSKKELGLPKEALTSLMTKELIYTGSKYPLCSLFRMRKFIQRGFYINAGYILKMVFQLHALDLYDRDVLADQLIGVDTTYMQEFLRTMDEGLKEGKTLDVGYLMGIIDKVFAHNNIV